METDQFILLMNKLDALHGDFREHKGTVDAKIAATNERVTNISDAMKTAGHWENAKVVASMIAMAIGHHIWGGKN